MYYKVIACEIAVREICYLAARTKNILDLEFLTQGYHDIPATGRQKIQEQIDAVPAGKYDAILLGYALCSNILVGLKTPHTPLVIPRGHDCITFFLGSKKRYEDFFNSHPGTYYYTSGWLECRQRRGSDPKQGAAFFLPASTLPGAKAAYQEWVDKYGEEQARYLLETMGQWSDSYSHGVLIDFDFTKPLELSKEVQKICTEHHWAFEEVAGDMSLLEKWVNGDWPEEDFLVVRPGDEIEPTYNEKIIGVKKP
jgi:hypothetical protein